MGKKDQGENFNRVASFLVCSQLDPTCNVDDETVAEIVVATEDGYTLVYSNSERESVGFVDISDPSNPMGLGELDLGGEPTSVAIKGDIALVCINTSSSYVDVSGELLAVDIKTQTILKSWDLGGQPDAIAVSPDKNFAVIAIENERDEDFGDGAPDADPLNPPGYVVVVNMKADSLDDWEPTIVSLVGELDGSILYPTNPEPEYVDINEHNIAVVTLQENNGIALIYLEGAALISSFTAGDVDLNGVDIEEEGIIDLSGTLTNVPREPDGVTWIGTEYFATADEGDLNGGSRGFTVFNAMGEVVYTSGTEIEEIVAAIGHYPDERSENKGNEPENLKYGEFGDDKLLFVNSERSSVILVYEVSDPENPEFLQVLPTGVGPEGSDVIPERNLLVVANEKDDRGDKMRSTITIYERSVGDYQYPSLYSDEYAWGAISGMSAIPDVSELLLAVEDSFYKESRVFFIYAEEGFIFDAIKIKDTNNVFAGLAPQGEFSADDLAAMINDDGTVNIDGEGVTVQSEGDDLYIWVAHEGRGTFGSGSRPVESLNFLFKIDPEDGTIVDVVTLPEEVNGIQLRFGFEGVAYANGKLVVAFQRAWGDEANPRIGIYDILSEDWNFVFYPLDTPESQNGGWVGLSDIAHIENNKFLVLERDNQGGPDAAIKRIYEIDLDVVEDATLHKTLVRDIVEDLKAPGGLVYEKVEGLALMEDGQVWISNDNDGVDDSNGETQLLNIGKYKKSNIK